MTIKSVVVRISCFLPLLIVSCKVVAVGGFLVSNNVPSNLPNSVNRIRVCYEGDKMRLGSTDKGVSISRGGADGGTSPEEERDKANQVMIDCAKITAISALLDFVVHGSKLFSGIADGKWLLPLTTLWKVAFSFNMWRVSKMYGAKTGTLAELYKKIENLMTSMTGIWRRLAFVVALLTTNEVVLAWKDYIPNVRLLVNVLFGVVGVVSVYLSTEETQTFKVAPSSPDSMLENKNEAPAERIARLGRITVRAMLLGVSAFLLDSIFIPIIAFRKKSWGEAIVELLNLTVSIPFATLLWKLRKSFIAFIEDLTDYPSLKNAKDWNLKPETQTQLAIAQQKFWANLKSFQVTQMFFKVVAVTVHLKVFQKLTLILFMKAP